MRISVLVLSLILMTSCSSGGSNGNTGGTGGTGPVPDVTSDGSGDGAGADTTGPPTGVGPEIWGAQGALTPCSSSLTMLYPEGKSFGEECTEHTDCQYGWCMLPDQYAHDYGTGPNLVNEVFGFCTRACDCNDTAASQINYEDGDVPQELWNQLVCLYAPGSGAWHHVIYGCLNEAQCTDVSPKWTDCRMPTSGTVTKSCHADEK